MEGRTLSHYRILHRIGGGGQGEVYKAEDLKLRRFVALKVLPGGRMGDHQHRRRLLREARAEAAVTHPNIASIYEADEIDGIAFIAMEWVDGSTLRALVHDRALAMSDALRIGSDVAEALEAAHRARIIHRDLKPENVIVRSDGHVKVLDFGLARLLADRTLSSPADLAEASTQTASRTQHGAIVGTTPYLSPEQARAQSVDHRTDIFTLGILLFEMATGRRPFDGPTPVDTISHILDREAPRPSELNSAVPAELDDLIARCLRKHPDERYQSAADLRHDLERIRERLGGPAPAPVARPAPPLHGALRRHPVVVVSGLLATAAIVATIVVMMPRPQGIQSLAVLPLENLSRGPEQDYFADAMTAELTASVSRIDAIQVRSRASAMRFRRPRKKTPSEIARELRVDALLDGTVQRAGQRVRITAELIEAASDRNVWSQTYERDIRDVLALQSEVAGAIANEVHAALSPREKLFLSSSRAVDPEAYDAYVKGRYYALQKWSHGEGRRRSIEFLNRAVELDPGFARAWSGLAFAWYGVSNLEVPASEAMPRVKAASIKAIELDPDLADAHALLASVKGAAEWDWPGAEREARQAIGLDPDDTLAQVFLAVVLVPQARYDEAVAVLKRAQSLDPLSVFVTSYLAFVLCASGRNDEALQQSLIAIQMQPDVPGTHAFRGMALEQKGDHAEAVASYKQAWDLDGTVTENLAWLGHARAGSGDRAGAESALADLLRMRDEGKPYVSPYSVAVLLTGLGRHREAIEWLQKGAEERVEWMTWLGSDFRLDPLRPDPDFRALVRRIGIKERAGDPTSARAAP